MQVVIFAGGLGTRISEETSMVPKPMIRIGDKPILWHIMKIFASFGHTDFIICAGYKSYIIKEYFMNFRAYNSDFSVATNTGKTNFFSEPDEQWNVTILDTGVETQTGGRLLAAKEHLDDTFLLTYGDGVADVNLEELLEVHRREALEVTLTAVQPEGRYGALDISKNSVASFQEKPKGDGAWVNGGFLVCKKTILRHLVGPSSIFEDAVLAHCASIGELSAYKHYGFWASMDTKRDHLKLNSAWENNQAKWKSWVD